MKTFSARILLLTALLATACGRAPRRSATDFTVEIHTPTYARGFDIRGNEHDDATLLTVRNPWQDAADVEQHLLLLRGDQPVPAGFEGRTVRVPVRRVVCMSSSHVALFEALGETRRICGVSGIDYISNPYVRQHRLCGEVRDVGRDSNLDFETLAALRPDAVLLYGITGENTSVTDKLRELGIPYLYIGDYTEPAPLGKAEWLMVAAELCGCRERGREVFDGIARRYNARKEAVAAYVGEHASDAASRPKVLLNTPYRDVWFMPAADSYLVRLIRDAGGDTFTAAQQGNASRPVELEEAYVLASDADVWLHTGACRTLDELKAQNPRFARVPAVRHGRVWNNDRRGTPAGGSDFWETGTVEPDVLLDDLFAIFYPGSGSGRQPIYYRPLP